MRTNSAYWNLLAAAVFLTQGCRVTASQGACTHRKGKFLRRWEISVSSLHRFRKGIGERWSAGSRHPQGGGGLWGRQVSHPRKPLKPSPSNRESPGEHDSTARAAEFPAARFLWANGGRMVGRMVSGTILFHARLSAQTERPIFDLHHAANAGTTGPTPAGSRRSST